VGYEFYTDHPESQTRKAEDFSAWSFWAPDHAPWTGVSLPEVAGILQRVQAAPILAHVAQTLDGGGTLDPVSAAAVLNAAEGRMSPKTREVFLAAVSGGYGVRVVFSKGGFGAVSASAYLAKHSSA